MDWNVSKLIPTGSTICSVGMSARAHAQDQERFTAPGRRAGHEQRGRVVAPGREKHQTEEAPVPPAVEHEAGDEQHDVLRAPREAVVQREHDDEESREDLRIECHVTIRGCGQPQLDE